MKKIISLVAAVVMAVTILSSCAIINGNASLASQAPIGQKMGESSSYLWLALFTTGGEKNNLSQAAQNGGVQKVSQVEYVDQYYLGGIVVKHTTRVYGE